MNEHGLFSASTIDREWLQQTTQATARHAAQYFVERELTSYSDLECSFRLRFEIYCREQCFLPESDYLDGKEIDRYDDTAWHFGSFDQHGELVGTVRLVRGEIDSVPLSDHCKLFPKEYQRLAGLGEVAEISRLAVNPIYRRRQGDGLYGLAKPGVSADAINYGRRPTMPVTLRLYRMMYHSMKREGRKHFLAAMERSLVTILTKFGFPFRQIGEQVDYYGPVVPYYLGVGELEDVLSEVAPDLFLYFRQGLEH